MCIILTLAMLCLDILHFDSILIIVKILISWLLRSQLIRIHIVFHSACKYMLITGMLQVDWLQTGVECST